MIKSCRNCKHSTIGEFDVDWSVAAWYCQKRKQMVPNLIIYICKDWETYESNLHDNNAAPKSPQARNNGIHQE